MTSLARARRAQGELAGAARLLDTELDLSARLEVLSIEGLATSAIEGEKLDPTAVRSSLARRLGVPMGGLRSSPREVDGLVEVLVDATANYDTPLIPQRLLAWQAALFPTGRSGLREIRVGKLRDKAPMQIVSGPVGKERVHYEVPPQRNLRAELDRFLDWFNSAPPDLDGLLRAGIAHVWFEILHPFEDGNGRVGRALLDMALAQDEARSTRLYSLSARFNEKRDEYYAVLERTSSGDLGITPWLTWFLEQVTAAAQSSELLVNRVVNTARFWLHHSRSELSERQVKALARLLDAGPGGFEGGMTNRKYASLTKTSPATAQRDLADLVAKRCLVQVGSGRAARYELANSA